MFAGDDNAEFAFIGTSLKNWISLDVEYGASLKDWIEYEEKLVQVGKLAEFLDVFRQLQNEMDFFVYST